jgi:hypothetical protein
MQKTLTLVVTASTLMAGPLAAQNRDANGKALKPAPAEQDRKMTLAPGTTLNFADTFTVARTADGLCDWAKTPLKPGKPGSGSVLAETNNARCWGVVWNLTFPPTGRSQMKVDSAMKRDPEGPPRADTIAILRPRGEGPAYPLARFKSDTARGSRPPYEGPHPEQPKTDTTVVPPAAPPPLKKKP